MTGLELILSQVPCPDPQAEKWRDARPYLEIARRDSGSLWVRCLTCARWLCPSGESDRALENAKRVHACEATR